MCMGLNLLVTGAKAALHIDGKNFNTIYGKASNSIPVERNKNNNNNNNNKTLEVIASLRLIAARDPLADIEVL